MPWKVTKNGQKNQCGSLCPIVGWKSDYVHLPFSQYLVLPSNLDISYLVICNLFYLKIKTDFDSSFIQFEMLKGILFRQQLSKNIFTEMMSVFGLSVF